MIKRRLLVTLGLVSGLVFWALADEAKLPILKTKPKSIAVFKNGLGFFTREGEVRPAGGWAVSDEVPQAALGSLWIGLLDKDARLEEVISLKDVRTREEAALSIADLLKANIGKRVAFTFDDKVIEGKIKSVPETSAAPAGGDLRSEEGRSSLSAPEEGTVVIVATPEGDFAFNKSMINRLQFFDAPIVKYPAQEVVKRLKFKVDSGRSSVRIGLLYLQKGISWTPAYLVDILDDQKVRMAMQALLVNEVEDFEETDLLFVVGYPNFIFSDVLSPMAQTQSLAQFLSSLGLAGRREMPSGQLLNIAVQRTSEYDENFQPGSAGYGAAESGGPEGMAQEDLFFYQKKGVSLKRGERALYPLFSEIVDYSPVYEWTVPDTTSVDAQGDVRRGEPDRSRDQVWHSLKLRNSTAYPWTTAPAMAVRNGKPVAQDILDYTSKNAAVNLKLTVASDVQTNRQEFEVERQRDVTVYEHSYDLVIVRGELKIRNGKDKAITMDVRKSLTGEGLEAGHQGRIQKMAEGLELRTINPNSRITWEVPLQPHQEITLTYKYRIYISH